MVRLVKACTAAEPSSRPPMAAVYQTLFGFKNNGSFVLVAVSATVTQLRKRVAALEASHAHQGGLVARLERAQAALEGVVGGLAARMDVV